MDTTQLASNPEDPNSPEMLAAAFVEARLAGSEPSVSDFLARLSSAAEKRRFLELIEGAESVDELLPRQVREGTLLSGRYRVRKEIGAGGMGKVFVAWDESLKREVAVKVLATIDTSAVDAGSMFERESELLARLQHPGIVSIHETGKDGDTRYLVMDLVRGRSLKEVLGRIREQQGDAAPPRAGSAFRDAIDLPMPDGGRDLIGDDGYCRVAARLAAEMARTIEAAHGEGVVHRDLKPGNVMIRGDGTPVLLDFGLAGRFEGESGELTRALFGSAPYLAPEQARSGETGSDPASDVYQLGLLLYELLTLRRAFPGEEVSSVLQDIGIGRFDPPRRHNRAIPVDLEAIALNAMELNPDRRYGSATELREDLERFLTGTEAPRAIGGGWIAMRMRDLRYFVRRNKIAVQIAAALLLGVVVTLFFGGDAPARFEHFTYSVATREYVERPVNVADGAEIGVSISANDPKWVYAYAVYGPDEDPHRYVVALEPLWLRGARFDVAEEQRFAGRMDAGTVDLRCSTASASSDWEGVMVIAVDERDPLLEWWLGKIKTEQTREWAISEIEGANFREVFAATRGQSVATFLTDEQKRALFEDMKQSVTERALKLPFDDRDHELIRLRVRKP